jgi:hypothetical protein
MELKTVQTVTLSKQDVELAINEWIYKRYDSWETVNVPASDQAKTVFVLEEAVDDNSYSLKEAVVTWETENKDGS